jgi:hypothetical protein
MSSPTFSAKLSPDLIRNGVAKVNAVVMSVIGSI